MGELAEQSDRCKELLAHCGIKSTRQRLAVLGVLRQSDTPLTAEDLYVGLREEYPSLSLSTVYRILDMLCKNGVVMKSGLMEGGKALFELTPQVHRHNLICVKCHKITPIQDCPLSRYESDVEKATGYSISGHKLEVYGVCPDCSEKDHG